ncbi:MAG: RNA methyltransferase [Treponema sp.]|nr:RNA methyltransferase [Treponema sp.]
MNICLFEKSEINKPLKLNDERAEHLIKILHKKEGDTFTAGIVGGKSGVATITKIILDKACNDSGIYFSFKETGEGKKLFPVKMIIGFPRPIQLKRLLRDIAALGVCEVHLTATELGEKSYLKSTLVEKGNAYKMLLDGTVQAGSTHVPALFIHKSLAECLDAVEEGLVEDTVGRLALDNVNAKCSLERALNGEKKNSMTIAAIGSERGWTDRERELLEKRGYIRCSMGERIMRTETAATVSGAIILNKLGFFGI